MYLIVRRFRPTNISERDNNAGFIFADMESYPIVVLHKTSPEKSVLTRRAIERVITQYASCASLNTINHCCFFDLRLRDILCTTSARIFIPFALPLAGDSLSRRQHSSVHDYTRFFPSIFLFFSHSNSTPCCLPHISP